MTKTRLMAFLVLSVTLICGCMGGGGGGGTPVFEKDVAGITTTLNRFAESLRTGDPTSSGIFAQTTGTSETTKILYVKDFGADLNNPNDNQTWEFRVNPADITQPAPDTAIVKASKVMSTGNTLWLIFSMLKEEGQWKIQGITIQETGVTTLVSASYFPIVPGNRMTYYGTNQGGYSISSREYSSTETYQYEGVTYYRSVSPGYGANLRQSGLTGIGSYFANRQGEIWTYDRFVNGGVPYRLLKASYAPGEKEVIVQKYGESETSTMTLTMGSQMRQLVTPLRAFMALPVTQESSHAGYGSAPATHTSILYFVEGVGLVGQEMFEPGTTTISYAEYLYERLVGGIVESNNPAVTSSAGNTQNVVIGQSMVPVQFNVTGGTPPYTWSVNDGPTGLSISSNGYLDGKPDVVTPRTYNLTVGVTDAYKRSSSFNYTLVLSPPGIYDMRLYKPVVGGDEYTYAIVDEYGEPVPGRKIEGYDGESTIKDGMTFYRRYDFYADAQPVPALNLRSSVRKFRRPAIRGELIPGEVYNAQAADGSIWAYHTEANGGQPYLIRKAWYNPGETFVVKQFDAQSGITVTTTMTIGNVLENNVSTPYGTFNDVLKITYDILYTAENESASQRQEQYCVKNLGVVVSTLYDEDNVTIIQRELLLSARLGGTTHSNLPQITNGQNLGAVSAGIATSIKLNATGGFEPYLFSLAPGATTPQGLSLSSSGIIEGTPTSSGIYNIAVILTDKYYQAVEKVFSITIN